MTKPSPSTPSELIIDLTELGAASQSDVALAEIGRLVKLLIIQLKRMAGDPITEADVATIMDYFDHAHVTAVTLWAIRQFPEQWDVWVAEDARDMPSPW